MWDIDSGLTVVRLLQQDIRKFGYHVAVGGGVVNKGFSNKDLDLYFLPMNGLGRGKPSDPMRLHAYLEKLWGPSQPLGSYEYGEKDMQPVYGIAVKFFWNKQKRIDCFIA